VYNKKGDDLGTGAHEIKINTADFAQGAYNVVIKTNEGVMRDKLLITK
jgi:hypothetical protein